MKFGFCLEGGGLRGTYTTGVLDAMLDHEIRPDYLIGVSAGATNGLSFLSGQRGRGLRVNVDYLRDKRYMGLSSYFKTKSYFGMDFLFDEIPNRLDPYDYDALYASPCEFVCGATDVETGKCVYFDRKDLTRDLTVLRASCSIPIFSPMVEYKGKYYLDGGASDPIPVKKALLDGCDRLLIILTRPRSYEKKAEGFPLFYKRFFRKHPEMARALSRRHEIYKESRDLVFALEKEGRAVVLTPSEEVYISRFEKDADKLRGVYKSGFKDGEAALERIKALG